MGRLWLQDCSFWVVICFMKSLDMPKSLEWKCFTRLVGQPMLVELGSKREGILHLQVWKVGLGVGMVGFIQQIMNLCIFWVNVKVIWELLIVGSV